MPDFQSIDNALVVIGPRACGKTHFLGLLGIHYRLMERRGEKIRLKILEELSSKCRGLPLREYMDVLSNGGTISHTEIGKYPFGGALIASHPTRVPGVYKRISIPIFDAAGEVYNPIMNLLANVVDSELTYAEFDKKFHEFLERYQLTKDDIQRIHRMLFSAKSYIVVLNLVHCLESFQYESMEKDPALMEKLKDKLMGRDEIIGLIPRYSRIIDLAMRYREQKGIGKPKNIAIVFTHYDYVKDFLEIQRGYEINRPNDRHLMANYLAAELAGTICADIGKEPEVFVSWTETGSTEIDPGCHMRIPKYPENEYYNIVNWIRRVYE